MFRILDGTGFRMCERGPPRKEGKQTCDIAPLGRTGIQVSPYCLGSMMFGAGGNPDHEETTRIVHKALDAGINFIDTADAYSRGESEEIIGRALKGRRDGVVLSTKVYHPMGKDPNQQGGSRRWITRAVEDSLRRLQTDYVRDLYSSTARAGHRHRGNAVRPW